MRKAGLLVLVLVVVLMPFAAARPPYRLQAINQFNQALIICSMDETSRIPRPIWLLSLSPAQADAASLAGIGRGQAIENRLHHPG